MCGEREGDAEHAAAARGRGARRAARPPPHLHAALAHPASHAMLAAALPAHHAVLKLARCGSEREVVELKGSLWALGGAATSACGMRLLLQLGGGGGAGRAGGAEDSVPAAVVRLAKYCPVYAVRATALYVLGLFGSTRVGADRLRELGGYDRRARSDRELSAGVH